MKLVARFTVLGLGVLATFVVGCSSESDASSADEDPSAQTATESCGPDKYAEGEVFYQRAVTLANDRLAHGTCASEEASTWAVADAAATAVIKCADFKALIKSNPVAEPIRKVLAESITLKSLNGDLRVLRASQWANWTNLENLLPGTVMSTEPQGAVGARSEISFEADGHATFVSVALNERESAATYTIEKTATEKEARRIVITHDDQSQTFDLVIDTPPQDLTSAPLFRLVPQGMEKPALWQTFNSLTRECGH